MRRIWRYDNPILANTVAGMHFPNPVGLSAGFDYDADLVDTTPNLGFGFHTVGTLTKDAYAGNPPPMLGRLPRSRSLLVNKGFKNEGIARVLPRAVRDKRVIPLGISIGATNKPYKTFEAMVENVALGFSEAQRFQDFDYFELNISCPNLLNIKNLPDQVGTPTGFKDVLDALVPLQLARPVFVKMPLERTREEALELMKVADPYPFVTGMIFSNLAKDRTNPSFDPQEISTAGQGNFSGKPTEAGSNELLRDAYQAYGKRYVLIGTGGVFSAEDAYRKILLGASLVQLITGMVYMGPQQIGEINRGLVQLLKRDGFRSIAEAVGSGNQT